MDEMTVDEAIVFLERIIEKPAWSKILGAMFKVMNAPRTERICKLLEDILLLDGELRIDETKECPHSKSPENMLKFLATQVLNRSGEDDAN